MRQFPLVIQGNSYFILIFFKKNLLLGGGGCRTLTTVGVAPLLQVGVVVEATVSRRDVLRGPRDGGLRHNRVGVR